MAGHLRLGVDGVSRCWWCGDDPLYVGYHDTEWGTPVVDSTRLFEKLCLEGFQSGLSWITVLRKRENFRRAFANFDVPTVAGFGTDDIDRLVTDAGIIRHRGKIEATVNNARCALEMAEGGVDLARHVWSFAVHAPFGRVDGPLDVGNMNTTSAAAETLSRDLKRRGWRFVGPTTVYSFMQSMGLVNDHVPGCHRADTCETMRESILTIGD
jgi:DNA-3-methyladenine glycosylase I